MSTCAWPTVRPGTAWTVLNVRKLQALPAKNSRLLVLALGAGAVTAVRVT